MRLLLIWKGILFIVCRVHPENIAHRKDIKPAIEGLIRSARKLLTDCENSNPNKLINTEELKIIESAVASVDEIIKNLKFRGRWCEAIQCLTMPKTIMFFSSGWKISGHLADLGTNIFTGISCQGAQFQGSPPPNTQMGGNTEVYNI